MNQLEMPTSVNATSWVFMILGGLSIYSGILYLYVGLHYQHQHGNDLFKIYSGILQIMIALGVVILGYKLRRGGKQTPKLVIITSILLALILIVVGIVQSREWSTATPLVSTAIYLVPLAFIVKAFMSEKVNAYYSELATISRQS